VLQFEIAGRPVGEGASTYVIAEAGSNHDRKLAQALKLIDVAVEAGADAVKFQTYSAEELYSRRTPTMSYLKKEKLTKDGESVWQLIKRIEMPREWHTELAAYCREKRVHFLSTPFDLKAVDQLEAVDCPAYKIASYEVLHLPLLKRVAETRKPVILSTGMASLGDIETALETLQTHGATQVVLLHCAINYPPRFEDVNLRAMTTMRQAFQRPVGFSDHTTGITVDIAAVALGATVIEKHYTLDRKLPGPDHAFAIEPDELRAMVKGIRECEAALGSAIKGRTAAEEEMYRLGRRSLVAATAIRKGTRITADMIAVKRPGFGIPTTMMDVVLGRTAQRDIEEDEILAWEMV
jgi:N-acetylneuraminate synthase